MKKKIKKIAGIFIAAVMLFAIAVPIVGAETVPVNDDSCTASIEAAASACGGTAGITRGPEFLGASNCCGGGMYQTSYICSRCITVIGQRVDCMGANGPHYLGSWGVDSGGTHTCTLVLPLQTKRRTVQGQRKDKTPISDRRNLSGVRTQMEGVAKCT